MTLERRLLGGVAMPDVEYEISWYRPEFMSQALDVLQYLYGDNLDSNLSYFKWKFHDNPYTEHPLGMVALHHGKVVGFRGYFATMWQLNEKKDKMIVLCPGDTCVHPNHRRKGLSVAMGNKAMEEYAQRYKIFFNVSATRNSLPGYLRMGFVPFVPKTYLTRCAGLGLFKLIWREKRRSGWRPERIAFGKFDDIIVSDGPRPKDMQAVVAGENPKGRQITLRQDEDFFGWRFNNTRTKYVFYYHRKDNVTTGYVVVGVSPTTGRGYILDYAQDDDTAIQRILSYAVKMKHFDVLSIYHFGLSDDLLKTLYGLRFKTNSLIRTIERRVKGELPLLLRPIRKNYVESDFFVNGLDMRRVDNWGLKGICADDV
jgi:GNAT superfamily N-acetyltransferase